MIGYKQQFVFGCFVLVFCLTRCQALVDGGGDCGTDGDCSYNGVCENDPKDKKVCMCVKEFGGAHCEEKLANPMQGYKDAPGKPKVSIEITTKDLKEDADEKTGTKRELEKLEFDKESDIIGISPDVLATSEQEFLIYSPITKLYMFVSYDITRTGGKYRTHVEGRGDRLGDRNIFTMKKLPSGKFRIHNKKTNKDVYISNSKSGVIGFRTNDILASDVTAKDQPKAEKFEFEFELNQDGTYGIKSSDDKYWFVSHDRAGVPLYRILSADAKNREKYQTQKFQLVLKYKAKEGSIGITFDKDKMKEIETKDVRCHRESFKNTNAKGADTKHTVSYTRTVTSTAVFREAKEFSVTAELSTAQTVADVLGITGKLSVTKKKTTETTDTKQVTETETVSQEIITKPGQINCVTILMTRVHATVPYKIKAVTKEGKNIEANGMLEGESHRDFHLSIQGDEYSKQKKCEWE